MMSKKEKKELKNLTYKDATHNLICFDRYGDEYYKPCIFLKDMSHNRAKVLVFGWRNELCYEKKDIVYIPKKWLKTKEMIKELRK